MKIKSLFAGTCILALTGLMASCTSDEIVDNGGNEKAKSNFLTISIAGNNESTRALPEGYEDGTEFETKVNSVRFYFFNEAGQPVNIKAPSFDKNYYSISLVDGVWKDEDNKVADMADNREPDESTTVSNLVQATIVVSTKEGDRLPSRMIAVCNYEKAGLGNNSMSVDELHNALYTRSTGIDTPGQGEFVMTNSTYIDANGEVRSTLVPASCICATTDQAKDNPVQIYVERVVAKVKANVTTLKPKAGSSNMYYTGRYVTNVGTAENPSYVIKNSDGTETEDEKIYVKFLGWYLSSLMPKAYLIKDVNPTWGNSVIGGVQWNNESYHRSFWGINPALGADEYLVYDNFDLTNAFKAFSGNGTSPHYILPNAATNADGTYSTSDTEYYLGDKTKKPTTVAEMKDSRTKVMILAQLVNSAGQPLYMSSWIGQTYLATSEAQNEANLKNAMCEILKGSIWKRKTVEGNLVYESMAPADIVLKTEQQSASAPDSETRRYTVWAEVKSTPSSTDWYADTQGNPFTFEGLSGDAAVNKYLSQLLPAKVWNTGYTYYYFPIKHLGGKYGVVRNHVYYWDITTLVGLGTPVFDPTEVIIPEKTEEQESYIAAEINVLAWRIVNNAATLEW